MHAAVRWIITNWLVTDPSLTAGASAAKNYQVRPHEGTKYIYLCGGRLRSVKQKPINIISGICILVPGVLFWVFEASWVWHHLSGSLVVLFSYFWFLSMMFFIKLSTSDPGIAVRNIHLPYATNEAPWAPDEYFNTVTLPYHDDTTNTGASTKYCTTCHIWRPPRASHCATCNSCVITHDHHCVYLNNCIGARNYRYFLWFLLSVVITCVFLIAIAFVHVFYYKTHSTHINSFKESISHYPVAFLLALYGCVGVWYPLLLLMFHIFLTACNYTTREYLNNVRGHEYTNVFTTGSIWKNLFIAWLGSPRGVSHISYKDKFKQGDIRFEIIDPLKSFTN